jgi:DNA polymerase-3 subunit beta
MSILTSDRNKGVNIKITKNQIEFSVNHPDLGAASDTMELDYSGEEEIELIINVSYFIEAISNLDSETITIEYFKEGAPLKFTTGKDLNYFSIVMPMRR